MLCAGRTMPTYLCHGFRWQRRSIRVFTVVQNLDDVSPEWIIPVRSAQAILESFYELFEFLPYCAPSLLPASPCRHERDDETVFYGGGGCRLPLYQSAGPGAMSTLSRRRRSSSRRPGDRSFLTNLPSVARTSSACLAQRNALSLSSSCPGDEIGAQDWSVVKVLEEYDPRNLEDVSRPYAYVADHVVRVDLSVSVGDEIQHYEKRLRADPSLSTTRAASDERERKLWSGDSGGSSSASDNRSNSQARTATPSGWLEQLRDQLQREEDIQWYVVVNGDETREWVSEEKACDWAGTAGSLKPRTPMSRSVPTPQQQAHHAQYIHQQMLFEKSDGQSRTPSSSRALVADLSKPCLIPSLQADTSRETIAAMPESPHSEWPGLIPSLPTIHGLAAPMSRKAKVLLEGVGGERLRTMKSLDETKLSKNMVLDSDMPPMPPTRTKTPSGGLRRLFRRPKLVKANESPR